METGDFCLVFLANPLEILAQRSRCISNDTFILFAELVDQRDIIGTGLVLVVNLSVGVVGCFHASEVALPYLIVILKKLGDLLLARLGDDR